MANLLTNPNLPNASPWGNLAGLGSVDIAVAADPGGGHDAFRMTDLDGTNATGWSQSVTIASDTVSRVSYVWVQKTSGATNFPLLDLRYGVDPAAPDKYSAVVINTDAGTVVPRSGWTPDAYGIEDLDPDFWRVYMALTNSSYTKLTFVLSPAFNANASNTPNVGTSGAAIFWGPTLEVGTAPPPPKVLVRDWRVEGAQYAAASVTTGLVAVSAPRTASVVLASTGVDVSLWPTSGPLDGAPGALVYGSVLWTVCADGYVRKLNATTAALISSVQTYSDTTNWLALNAEGVLIAPGARGEVCTVTATTITDSRRVLPNIAVAAYTTSRYLYAICDNGTGAVVSISAAGAIEKVAEFAAAGCRAARRAKIIGGNLVVACADRVVTFNLSTPTAPTVSATVKYTVEVFSVAEDGTAVTATAAFDQELQFPIHEALYSGGQYTLLGPSPFIQVGKVS